MDQGGGGGEAGGEAVWLTVKPSSPLPHSPPYSLPAAHATTTTKPWIEKDHLTHQLTLTTHHSPPPLTYICNIHSLPPPPPLPETNIIIHEKQQWKTPVDELQISLNREKRLARRARRK